MPRSPQRPLLKPAYIIFLARRLVMVSIYEVKTIWGILRFQLELASYSVTKLSFGSFNHSCMKKSPQDVFKQKRPLGAD